MTPDEVKALSEHELERYVATLVYGMHIEVVCPAWYHGGRVDVELFFHARQPLVAYSWDENASNAIMYRNGVDASDGSARSLPLWSTEIDRAWEVVEHMREHHPPFRAFRLESAGVGYIAAFYSHSTPLTRLNAFAHGEDASLAICRAAVLALSDGPLPPREG